MKELKIMKKPFLLGPILSLTGISLATVYVATSILFATQNIKAKEMAEVAFQEEVAKKAKEKREREINKLKYHRFHVQFFKPIPRHELKEILGASFSYCYVEGYFPTDLKSVHEVNIGSEMTKEQVREALLNWKKVAKVLTYREIFDAAFPEVEGIDAK